MKKILILGSTGLVGSALVNELTSHYDLYCLTRGSYTNDLATYITYDLEKEDMSKLLRTIEPDVIISCTRGDYDAQLKAHDAIGLYASKCNVQVIYFSTANVFDGKPIKSMYEADVPAATSDYGKFKLSCENLLMKNDSQNLAIIRLPMVFGKNAPRVKQMTEGMAHTREISVYKNLNLTTVLDTTIAEFVADLLTNHLTGIFHLASTDVINHFDFYDRILKGVTPLKLEVIEDYDDYYLSILSSRKEMSKFQFTNEDVINSIIAFLSDDSNGFADKTI